MEKVLCLAGPTGCGKTALAVRLAKILNCEVINADSRQVYKDFPIVSAQPAPEEMAGIPHHLYGFLPVESKYSAAQWAAAARDCIKAIRQRGKNPLLVGGTGFYLHSLLNGLAEIPEIGKPVRREILARMENEGPAALYDELCDIDPETAKKIHPHDRQRICRALEVWHSTGKTLRWWHSQPVCAPVCQGLVLWLDCPLDALEPALEERIDHMLAAGAVEEVRKAALEHPDYTSPGWKSIGCAELLLYLQKGISLEECKKLWLRATRAYARRQRTWFRHENKWLPFRDAAELQAFAVGSEFFSADFPMEN